MRYMVECGLQNYARGEDNGMSILKEDQVRDIHRLYREQMKLRVKRWQTIQQIAKKFEVSERHIDRILGGRRWRHIYEEFE